MSNNRTFYAKRNIIYGMSNKIIGLIFPFLIRTITIRKLGAEYLGLNSLFTAILQAFSMAELGFSSAIVFKMYKPMAENDEDKICALLALYRKVYRTIGMIVLAIGIVLMPFIEYLIKGAYPKDINIYFLYLIFLSGTVISYFGVAYKSSLLSVAQRQDVISNVDTILVSIRSTIQIVILLILENYYLYIVWTPIFVLINNLIIAYISRKMYPRYICRGKIEKSEINDIVTQIKGIAIGKAGMVSRNSFDSIALSMYSGLVEVSIYSNYYYVFTAVSGFLGVIVQSITGGIGNSLVVETKEKNYYDFKKFNFYYAWIIGWCTVCLFCMYQQFMYLWVGAELIASYETMILFCVYFYISQMGQIRAIYASASGIWWEFRNLQIAEAIANPVLNFGLGYLWGMNGILIATIVTVLVFSVVGIGKKTVSFCFERGVAEYFGYMCIYTVVTIFACWITGNLCSIWSCGGVLEFFLRSIVCIIVPNIIFFVLAMVQPVHRKMIYEVKNIL